MRYKDANGEFVTTLIGAAAGGYAGWVAGGWQGAIAGGVIGGVVGTFAPEFAAAVGGYAGEGIAGWVAGTATYVVFGAGSGTLATLAGNGLAKLSGDCKPWDDGLAYGTAVGAFSVLGSGEAFLVGAGGAAAFGEGTATAFGGISGGLSIIGAATDPGALHGFRTRDHSEVCGCR